MNRSLSDSIPSLVLELDADVENLQKRRQSTIPISGKINQSQNPPRVLDLGVKESIKRFLSSKSSSLTGSRRRDGLIDNGELHGKIKVLANIRNADNCLSTALSEDGRYYVVSLFNGIVNVYNSRNDNLLYSLNKPKNHNGQNGNGPDAIDSCATCVRFKPLGNKTIPVGRRRSSIRSIRRQSQIFVGSGSGMLMLPNLVPKAQKGQQEELGRRRSSSIGWGRRGSVDSDGDPFEKDAGWKQDYLVTATFTNGMVKTYRFLTDECLQTLYEHRETLTMDYCPGGKSFATGGGDGCIKIYDAETGKCTLNYKPRITENEKFQRIYSLAYHPLNESEFLAGGWDGKVRFYDSRSPNPQREIYNQFICGEGIAFHPSGNEFCTASWTPYNTLQIFDYRSSATIRKFDKTSIDENHKPTLSSSLLYSVKYYGNGSHLILGGSEPSSLTLIDSTTGKLVAGICDLKQSVYCVNVCGSSGSGSSYATMITGNEVALMDFFLTV